MRFLHKYIDTHLVHKIEFLNIIQRCFHIAFLLPFFISKILTEKDKYIIVSLNI
ncbi:hypothetical protein BHECKSOX2_537 [Bathymodiolus heckerae thiotrophic gill symbiont]|nr:hypothetical protein BHECKSOX2_537 [Bathymodiolus heckerae thiotrophic gill symbiont]